MADEELDLTIVPAVVGSGPIEINPFEFVPPGGAQRIRQRENPPPTTLDRFEELARLTGAAHRALVKKDAKARYCIYRKGERVFIDVVTLNENGGIDTLTTKDITADSFDQWARHLGEQAGLVFDSQA